ncbi:unnamed protein product, partial [Mesorhabditis spiculigera]
MPRQIERERYASERRNASFQAPHFNSASSSAAAYQQRSEQMIQPAVIPSTTNNQGYSYLSPNWLQEVRGRAHTSNHSAPRAPPHRAYQPAPPAPNPAMSRLDREEAYLVDRISAIQEEIDRIEGSKKPQHSQTQRPYFTPSPIQSSPVDEAVARKLREIDRKLEEVNQMERNLIAREQDNRLRAAHFGSMEMDESFVRNSRSGISSRIDFRGPMPRERMAQSDGRRDHGRVMDQMEFHVSRSRPIPRLMELFVEAPNAEKSARNAHRRRSNRPIDSPPQKRSRPTLGHSKRKTPTVSKIVRPKRAPVPTSDHLSGSDAEIDFSILDDELLEISDSEETGREERIPPSVKLAQKQVEKWKEEEADDPKEVLRTLGEGLTYEPISSDSEEEL